jgi:hypothetical protein
MLESLALFAAGLSALAFIVLAAAVWMHGRVLGRISAVERDHLRYQTAVEQLDIRITREVKARAGLARAETAEQERSMEQQARDHLAEPATNVTPLKRRPSPITGR